jgi:hypothetical protein
MLVLLFALDPFANELVVISRSSGSVSDDDDSDTTLLARAPVFEDPAAAVDLCLLTTYGALSSSLLLAGSRLTSRDKDELVEPLLVFLEMGSLITSLPGLSTSFQVCDMV